MRDISVIIACYSGEATLAETLESLTVQVWDDSREILLADNGSTDASAERGKSVALNAGLAAAAGRAFLFVDSDDTVPPDWLAAMARALGRHDFVATYSDASVHNKDWVRTFRERANKAPGLRRLTHPRSGAIAFRVEPPLPAGVTQRSHPQG